MLKTGLALALLALGGACTTAPSNVLGVNYHFASTSSEVKTLGATADTDITALEATYEFLPILQNANIAVSYLRREDEQTNLPGNPTVESDIVRAQLRFYFQLLERVIWYVGPGIGYAFAVDPSPQIPGVEYDGSLYYDAEIGVKWYLLDRLGLSGLLNYSFIDVKGDGATPDSDLEGITFGAGVFIDF
ncbi:MAG: hypothetical protein EYC70_12545 [Planctomycetota bacterium]|nr:MAG: hypothetical protein EYC70_12545 [Planctomycetota bacterium]